MRLRIPALLIAIEKASATAGARPDYLGVEFANGDSTAPVVAGVEPASPAQAAGILPGDIISKIGTAEVPNTHARSAKPSSRSTKAQPSRFTSPAPARTRACRISSAPRAARR